MMCGIAGIFNLNLEPVNRDLLIRMTRELSHRGPDDEGVSVWGGVGFGHRRLSIIDLSERGKQPMSNEDGTVWISYNGEIYNHLKLRLRLKENGHQYRSQTDTETIIHLYEEEGPGCLEHLDGEFAFSIWDDRRKTLFCARDRLGIKPFYYYASGSSFTFASEIKAILLHPAIRKEADIQSLSDYLSFSVSPAPATLFKGICKLEAGHYLSVSRDGGMIKKRYWDAIPKGKIRCLEQEAVKAIQEKVRESVAERMMSDVPLGVFLSGGLDSSANVAFMSRLGNKAVKTFNVAVKESLAYDESHFAGLVSREFRSEHYSLDIGFEGFRNIFDDLAYHTDEPLGDYACIPNFYLAKLAKEKGVAVIQVGEGNDELFCGYPVYAAMLKLERFFCPLPYFVRNPLFHILKSIRGSSLHYSISRAAEDKEIFLGSSYLFGEDEKEGMFNKSADYSSLRSSADYALGIYRHLLNEFPQAGLLDKMIYLDLKLRLPELLLMRADKMTMANSVEARLPYLDYQLVEYALSLPDNFKYRLGQGKYIFKKSLSGILPREVIFQAKKGFAGNPVNIFNRDFRQYLDGLYKDTEPLLGEWFNIKAFRESLAPVPGKMSFRQGAKVWSLFVLMLWLKRFFLNR